MSSSLSFPKLPCVILVAGTMVGCVNAPLKQGLPAQQAMTQAYAQLYNTANYQFSGQMKLDQMDIRQMASAKKQAIKDDTTTDQAAVQARKEVYIAATVASASIAADKAGKPLSKKQRDSLQRQAEQDVDKTFATQSDAQPKDTPDSSSGSPFVADKFDSMIYDMMKVYSERYRFNYSGVVDLRHKKLELIPELRYEARNMAGYARVPMLFDLTDATVYADLSALSPWFVNAGSEGKYTRFDLKKYQDKVDVNRAFALLRDTALASYQLGEQGSFSDVAVTPEERALGAKRKIQFETPLSQYFARLTTYVAINKESFQAVLPGKSKDSSAAADAVPANAGSPAEQMDAAAVKSLIKNQPEMYHDILAKVEENVDPGSMFRQEALLDAKGRVIQSRWQAYLVTKDTDKYAVKLKLSNQVNFTNYGSAVVSYQPKEGNWVDLKASTEGSLFGGLLDKNIFGTALDEYNRKVKEKQAQEKSAAE